MTGSTSISAGLYAGRKALGAAIIFCAALGLAGCGGGASADVTDATPQAAGSDTPPSSQALTITTESLPSGRPGQPFPTTVLAAAPADSTLRWSLADGTLPDGLTLSPDGRIAGTPVEPGVDTFTARATCGTRSATRSFAVSIATFALVALEGVRDGTAATDTAVTLACAGAAGDVRFEIVANGSGGFLGEVDGRSGRATWRTGNLGGGALDRLRATDISTGATAELDFAVERDPTAGYAAEFGTTDVWYVDTTRKNGPHAFATDFQAMLADTGLRIVSSTSREGTQVDRLAEGCVRLAMLRHLNTYFLRGADGSRGAGLPVSFPWAEPVGKQCPAAGSWLAGAPTRYSVISLVHGSNPGIVGTAFTDGAQNGNHENDTTSPGVGELGVFGNRFVGTINLAYNNLALLQDPLSVDDLETLTALYYGLRTTDPRAPMLRNAIEGVGRSIASVAAHEIGHSLGLAHTSPYVAGSIMNSTAVFSPAAPQFFTAQDVTRLRGALPGPGRQGSPTSKFSLAPEPAHAPEGGLTVCNLTLAPAPSHCGCGHHAR